MGVFNPRGTGGFTGVTGQASIQVLQHFRVRRVRPRNTASSGRCDRAVHRVRHRATGRSGRSRCRSRNARTCAGSSRSPRRDDPAEILARAWSACLQPRINLARIENSGRVETRLDAALQFEHRAAAADETPRHRDACRRNAQTLPPTPSAPERSAEISTSPQSQRCAPPHSIIWGISRQLIGNSPVATKSGSTAVPGIEEIQGFCSLMLIPAGVTASPPSWFAAYCTPCSLPDKRNRLRPAIHERCRNRVGFRAQLIDPADMLIGAIVLERRASLRFHNIGITRIETSRMTPRVPSEPTSKRDTSKPATFLITRPPKLHLSHRDRRVS